MRQEFENSVDIQLEILAAFRRGIDWIAHVIVKSPIIHSGSGVFRAADEFKPSAFRKLYQGGSYVEV
jgi:hypothetical protein